MTMGLLDMFADEGSVEVKMGQFTALIKSLERSHLMAAAIERGMPLRYIQLMFTDSEADYEKDMDELEKYRASGITPENMAIIDDEYRKLSRHNAELMESVAELTKYATDCNEEIGRLKGRIRELEAGVAPPATGTPTHGVIEIHVPGDPGGHVQI